MKYAFQILVPISVLFLAASSQAVELLAGDRITISNGMTVNGGSEYRLVCGISGPSGNRLINMSARISDEAMRDLEADRTMVQSALLDGQNVEVGSFRPADFKIAAKKIRAGLSKTAQLYIEAVEQKARLAQSDLTYCEDELKKNTGAAASGGSSQGTKK